MNDQQKSEKLNCDDQQNSETYFFFGQLNLINICLLICLTWIKSLVKEYTMYLYFFQERTKCSNSSPAIFIDGLENFGNIIEK